MAQTNPVVNWFEIPVADMARAEKFYGTILGLDLIPLPSDPSDDREIRALPGGEHGMVGALVRSAHNQPSATGTVIYLNGGDDLSTILDKVEGAGGKVVMPKTDIGQYGFIGQFTDSEGNRVALHNP
jgi:hypothetical protein